MPFLKSSRHLLLTIAAYLSFTLTCKADTWKDPFWNEGLKTASLVATGEITKVAEGSIWVTLKKVYKGGVSSGQEVEILLIRLGHSAPRFDANMELVVVLETDKKSGKYITFTPSFGIYPIRDGVVWLPLQDPLRYCKMSVQLSDQLIRLAIDKTPLVADSLRKTALTGLNGQDPFSKKENELEQQNLMLQLFARASKKEDISFIVPFLKSPYWTIRGSAVQALGHIASAKAIPYLTDFINNEVSDNVLSLAGEALWQSGGASGPWLEQRIAKASRGEVALANDIMIPVFNTLPAPRYSLATAIMRAEGNKASYTTLLSQAPGWLKKNKRIYISPLEDAVIYYGFEQARTMPVDSVLILNFNSDTFSVFPPEIFRYRKLRQLDIGGCPVKVLPDAIDRLTELEIVKISGKELADLTPGLFRLKNLRELQLSHMELDSLPTAIGQLSKLEVLSYGGRAIHTLPESVGRLTQLRELNLRMAGIDSLPAGIALLPSLKEVELYGNDLKHFPESLLRNAAVSIIHLGSNDISSIPADLSSMKNLRYIDLSYNPLPLRERERIDSSYKGIVINTETYKNRAYSFEEAVEHSELAGAVQIRNTDLSARTDLDFSLLQHTNHLVLTDNHLEKFPESICKMTNLESLRIDNNGIKTIPDCIVDMKGLKTIFLSGNDIASLPSAMAQMEQLEKIYLTRNKLTDLPDWIGKLKNLKELSVADNSISAENKAKIKSWFAGGKVLLFVE